MRLGILNACTPQEEIEFNAVEMVTFQEFINLADQTITLVEYRITQDAFPNAPDACDAFLITGSPKGVYDSNPWIAQLSQFIVDCHNEQKKLVGICFGHQMLAHSLGGHAEKSPKGWGLGLHQVQVSEQQSWMKPSLPQGSFHFCHQDQVTRLPAEAERLAGNTFCPNGMFVIGDHVLGIQAHPEFTKKIMDQTLDWFQGEMGESWREMALVGESNQEADNVVMAQWVVNFLKES